MQVIRNIFCSFNPNTCTILLFLDKTGGIIKVEDFKTAALKGKELELYNAGKCFGS